MNPSDHFDEETQRHDASTDAKPFGSPLVPGSFGWGRLVDGIPSVNLNRFQLVREIGRGGFGVVYLALDEDLNRKVAIKIARPELTQDPDGVKRFRQEAQAAASLSHPGIVPVFEIGDYERLQYYVMPYLDAPNLMEWMQHQPQPIAERMAAQIVIDLAHAIHHGHERGIVHRDLKPHNVLMLTDTTSRTGFRPMLLDFGLSKATESLSTTTSVLIGTPMYMAPEQATQLTRKVTRQSDIYSLGVIFFQLLTNRLPLQANTLSEAIAMLPVATIPPPSQFRTNLSEAIEMICLQCLRKDPSRRYATGAELAEDLERYLQGSPIHAHPVTWIERFDFNLRFHGYEQQLGRLVISMNIINAVWTLLVTFLLRWVLRDHPNILSGFWPMLSFLIFVATPIHVTGIKLGQLMVSQKGNWLWLAAGAIGSGIWDVYLWVITLSSGGSNTSLQGSFMKLYEGSPMAQLMVFCLIALGFAVQTICLSLGAWCASKRNA